jgi:hypothetical protein
MKYERKSILTLGSLLEGLSYTVSRSMGQGFFMILQNGALPRRLYKQKISQEEQGYQPARRWSFQD